MRTTLTLDNDVVELAKQHAKACSTSLGKAVSHLVRRGARYKVPTRVVNGIHVIDLPPDSPEVTSELVKRLELETE